MIHFIHQCLFYSHVAIGTVALFTFWVPVFAVKGGAKHKSVGKIFAWSMYTVAITGLFMTLIALAMPLQTYDIDPNLSPVRIAEITEQIRLMNSFLFMLSLLVLNSTHHALSVVKYKLNRDAMKSTMYLLPIILLGVCGIGMAVIGYLKSQVLFMVFGGISISASFGMLKYIFQREVTHNRWLIEHFSGLIGSGIGAYTAFFAFGGRRILGHIFVGQLQLIPWIAPAVIGTAFTFWLTRKYQQQAKKVVAQASSSRKSEVANAPLGNEKLNTSAPLSQQ